MWDKEKQKEYMKQYKAKNATWMREDSRLWYLENYNTKVRDYNLKKHFGISLKDYTKMWHEQLGCCAICDRFSGELIKNMAVDHDHNTGKIRGLLCTACNTGLGKLKDDKKMLQKALFYLRKGTK